jgi:hypothetical protein
VSTTVESFLTRKVFDDSIHANLCRAHKVYGIKRRVRLSPFSNILNGYKSRRRLRFFYSSKAQLAFESAVIKRSQDASNYLSHSLPKFPLICMLSLIFEVLCRRRAKLSICSAAGQLLSFPRGALPKCDERMSQISLKTIHLERLILPFTFS